MEKIIKQDLWREHDLHTSEDWAELKLKCSECYKAVLFYENRRKFAEKSPRSGQLEDLHFNTNWRE